MKIIFVLSICVASLVRIDTDVYSAVADIQKVLLVGEELVHVLQEYIQQENKKVAKVQNFLSDYKEILSKSINKEESFIGHPVNALMLIKRMTTNWWELEKSINQTVGMNELRNRTSIFTSPWFPKEDDLHGAASAVVRLQNVYKLETSSLVQGIIGNEKAAKPMSGGDCLEIGRHYYSHEEYDLMNSWLTEAYKNIDLSDVLATEKHNILEYFAYSAYQKGNVSKALELTEQLLILAPNHPRGLRNKHYYRRIVQTNQKKKKGENGTTEEQEENDEELKDNSYSKKCRGEKLSEQNEENNLHCQYTTRNHPYLLIAPVREEEASLDPRIVMYHNVLFDTEIEVMMSLAKQSLNRSKIVTAQSTDEIGESPERVSKNAWLWCHHNSFVDRFCRRVEQITGLDMKTSELLQVANYGLGGHYMVHTDYSAQNEVSSDFRKHKNGDRIATWLAYMTDVLAGGYTVFTNIGLHLVPQKGSAVLWYNLHRNGSVDWRTIHAGCPVLLGSKWIVNQWFREHGQERARPCSLNQFE